jgi:hypothetical protein
MTATDEIAEPLARDGFAFIEAPAMEALLRNFGLRNWNDFASSWNDLGLDTYMADGGRYRRRRHAAYAVSIEAIERKPHQPHYQSRDYNPLNGGIERWFDPVSDAIGRHPALLAILRAGVTVFDRLTPPATKPKAWHVEVHQFRVEARPGEPGLPTPEGLHRDGVDWVIVLLIGRTNVQSGTTTISDAARRPIGKFTLVAPLDAALVDDSRVFHGVTSIEPADPGKSGHRDVLVVTFRR